jgi:O-antigen ligase
LIGIYGLYLLNRDPKAETSKALWIPLIWLLIAGSRNVGEWLGATVAAPSTTADPYIEGNPIDRNLLAGLVAIGVIILIRRRGKVGKILLANWPILLYFTYCLVSVLWSDYPYVGFKRWIRSSGDFVMVLVILSERDWLAARKKILAWPAFVLLPLSILFIRYYPQLGRTFGQWDYVMSWTGVSSTKNGLGMISMIFGLASAWRFLDAFFDSEMENRAKVLIAHGTILAMAVYLLEMAHSATSLACFFLGCIVLVVTSWRPLARFPGVAHILVWSLLFISFSSLFLNIGSSFVEDLGRNASLTGRTDVWNRVLTLVKDPVFGTGFESFWVGPRLAEMRALDPGLNQAHNGYLEIYLNLGWIGVTLFVILILTGYRNVISAFHRDPNPAKLGIAYLVIALSYNFTEAGFKMMNPTWILFLLSIVTLPVEASEENNELPPVAPLRDRKTFQPKAQEKEPLVVGVRKRTI